LRRRGEGYAATTRRMVTVRRERPITGEAVAPFVFEGDRNAYALSATSWFKFGWRLRMQAELRALDEARLRSRRGRGKPAMLQQCSSNA
jgi:hypothetical protein